LFLLIGILPLYYQDIDTGITGTDGYILHLSIEDFIPST